MAVKISRDSDPVKEREAGNPGGLFKGSCTDSLTNTYPELQGRTAVQNPPEVYWEKLNCVTSGKGPCVLMLKPLPKPTDKGRKQICICINLGNMAGPTLMNL